MFLICPMSGLYDYYVYHDSAYDDYSDYSYNVEYDDFSWQLQARTSAAIQKVHAQTTECLLKGLGKGLAARIQRDGRQQTHE